MLYIVSNFLPFCGPPLHVCLLTTLVSPNIISSLLVLLFVHYLFESSFINSNALYLFIMFTDIMT